MDKRFLITLITLIMIAAGAALAVFFVKGYNFSIKDGKIVSTGIISVTSVPDGASVYIDGHLTTATNTTLSQLQPKSYNLKIVKEGFIPWEKQIQVSEGLVTEIKATLFPALPTIYPLTYNGVVNPILSPDGEKLAFAVPYSTDSHSRQRGGIWVWTMTSQPISFARAAEPHQLVVSSQGLDFSKAALRFSPDSSQVLVTLQEGDVAGEASQRNYLLSLDRQTSINDLKDITPVIAATLMEWNDDQEARDEVRLSSIGDLKIKEIASRSAQPSVTSRQPSDSLETDSVASLKADVSIKWSPDETKFMVIESSRADKSLKTAKVYDLSSGSIVNNTKQSKTKREANQALLIGNKEYQLPEALSYSWLPDSKHIIIVQSDKIGIAELDGTNVAEIYAGKFEGTEVFPWPDSSRLVVLTSYATPTASKPNLFGINLK